MRGKWGIIASIMNHNQALANKDMYFSIRDIRVKNDLKSRKRVTHVQRTKYRHRCMAFLIRSKHGSIQMHGPS